MPTRRSPNSHELGDLAGLRVALYCRVSDDEDRESKSVGEQEAEGREWVERHQAVLVGVFADNDRSASRFAPKGKTRDDYDRLLTKIRAGEVGAVWFWEGSRTSRRLGGFAELRDLCRERNVLWIARDRVQNPADYRDMTMAAIQAVISEQESEQTSERVTRGMWGVAQDGKPHGRWTYGYRRHYRTDNRKLDRIEPDEFDGDGVALQDSPAWVVREVFRRIAAGDPLNAIMVDLNARKVLTPGALRYKRMWEEQHGTDTAVIYPADLRATDTPSPRLRARAPRWTAPSIKVIARNPAYIGRRTYQAGRRPSEWSKFILEGIPVMWEPLVEEETFWAVQRILDGRRGQAPGAAKHLLSWIVACAECGSPLTRQTNKPRPGYGYAPRVVYCCAEKSCVAINKETLDDYVQEVVIGWLSRPAVFEELTRADSTEARQARADADRARAELERLYRDAAAGDVSPTIATRSEKGLLERIAEAERRERAATMPSILEGHIGPEAEAAWNRATVAVQRQIIRSIASIEVRRIGKGQKVPVRERVEIVPLFGPGADQEQAG